MKNIFNLAKVSLLSAVVFAVTPVTNVAHADNFENNDNKVIIYFTRHAEKQTVTTEGPDNVFTGVCGVEKCAEELSPKGQERADLLVDWFERRNITQNLTHAFSSHKTRTRQTIEQIVAAAGLSGDSDKNAGDGIQEYPTFVESVTEVEPEVIIIGEIEDGPQIVQIVSGDGEDQGFATELNPEGTSRSEQPTIDALLGLENGSVALVAGHSGTLYDIMYGIGLTDACTVANIEAGNCNADRYPFNSKKKVANFGDIWKVVLKGGQAKFKYRKNLKFNRLTVDEIAR